jgi:hypothetical protein
MDKVRDSPVVNWSVYAAIGVPPRVSATWFVDLACIGSVWLVAVRPKVSLSAPAGQSDRIARGARAPVSMAGFWWVD